MKKQKKIFSSKIIFLFGAGVIAVFILLYHKIENLKSMFALIQPDSISILYLELLVDMNPNDSDSRLALAHQYVKIGDLKNANVLIKPLLNTNGRLGFESKLLEFDLELNDYFTEISSDTTKAKKLIYLKEKISNISNENIPEDLFSHVIERSLTIEKPDIAAKLYEHWGDKDSINKFHRLQEAGRWYIAAGKPMSAAEMYNKAFSSSNHTETAKKYALLAIEATRAANKSQIGLEYLKRYLARFPNDEDLLSKAIALALATNDPNQAYELGKLHLSHDPNNSIKINKQLELALATSKMDEALQLADRLLNKEPQNHEYHIRAAKIAEWSGKSDLALKHWAWLLNHGNLEANTHENFFRLAYEVRDPDLILYAFIGLADKRSLNDNELTLLVSCITKITDYEKAFAFMHNYLENNQNQKAAWIALIITQEKAGQLKQAFETLNLIPVLFKRDLDFLVIEADLLRKKGLAEQALRKLLTVKKITSPKEIEYWQLLAELCWVSKDKNNGIEAYHLLWSSPGANREIAERLIQLFRNTNRSKQAIAVAKEAHHRFAEPRWLLLAMDTASQFKLSKELKELMREADAHIKQYKNKEMYWLLRAEINRHNQQPYQALKAYKQALKIKPASKIARDGILWTLIELQEDVNSRINMATHSAK